jgi:AcrR family transcriptional regulator
MSERITKERILNAALELAKTGGALSMRKIAAQAKCAPPSIYHYFDKKSDVTFSLFNKLFVREGMIQVKEFVNYCNENLNVFNAMFNDGETNINIKNLVDELSESEQNEFVYSVGFFIIDGVDHVKQHKQ